MTQYLLHMAIENRVELLRCPQFENICSTGTREADIDK